MSLKLRKVRPEYDDSNAHTLVVETSRGNFETPCQILNSNELNAFVTEGAKFGDLDQIQLTSEFDRRRISRMRTNGGLLNQTIRGWGVRCSAFTYKSCVPVVTRARELSEEDVSFLGSMQRDAGMDIVYYPAEGTSPARFAGRLDRFRDEMDWAAPDVTVMPVLNLGDANSTFMSKFDHLMDSGYSAVCLWYAGLNDSRSKLYSVQHNARKHGMWVVLSNYPVKYSNEIPASSTHVFPCYGVDSFVKETSGFPSYLLKKGQTSLPPRDPSTIRFFGTKTLGILDQKAFRREKESLASCSCRITHGSTIENILSKGGNAAARLSRIHTAIAGETVLAEMRTRIRENDLTRYLKSRKFAARAMPLSAPDNLFF